MRNHIEGSSPSLRTTLLLRGTDMNDFVLKFKLLLFMLAGIFVFSGIAHWAIAFFDLTANILAISVVASTPLIGLFVGGAVGLKVLSPYS